MATGTNGIPTIGELRELFPEANIPTGQPDNKCVLVSYCALDQASTDIDEQYTIPFIHIPYVLEGNYTDYKLNQLAKFSDIRFVFFSLDWHQFADYDGSTYIISVINPPKSTIYVNVEVYGRNDYITEDKIEVTPNTREIRVYAPYQTIGTPDSYIIGLNENSPQYDDYYYYG